MRRTAAFARRIPVIWRGMVAGWLDPCRFDGRLCTGRWVPGSPDVAAAFLAVITDCMEIRLGSHLGQIWGGLDGGELNVRVRLPVGA
jgi:hypothetical protein